jgi:hypothetical protein
MRTDALRGLRDATAYLVMEAQRMDMPEVARRLKEALDLIEAEMRRQ